MAYKGPHDNQAWFVHISLDPEMLRQGNIHWTAIDNVPGLKFKFISEFIPFNSFQFPIYGLLNISTATWQPFWLSSIMFN